MDLVILAGSVGKGAAWARGCMKPLLPLPAKSSLIEAFIRNVASESIQKCIICTDGHKNQFVKRLGPSTFSNLKIDFFEDSVPLGTAGCLKACESRTDSEIILLAGGSVWLDDDPHWMLEEHRRAGNALTVFCTRNTGWASTGVQQHLRPAGLFCCDRTVFKYIRPSGFQDLKEQLVPALKRAGLRVGAVALPGGSCEVSDPSTYMEIIAHVLAEGRFSSQGFSRIAPDIWCGSDVHIAPQARIVGPVLLGHGCIIEDGAVIVGPAMLGDGSHIGRNARLIRVVAPRKLRARPGLYLTDRVLTAPSSSRPKAATKPPATSTARFSPRALATTRKATALAAGIITALFATFAWAFWGSISNLWDVLRTNPDYSAGQLVPVAALYMISTHKEKWNTAFRIWQPGLLVFVAGLLTNVFGFAYRFTSVENFGLVTAAVGMIASIIGRRNCSRLWFPLCFLFLMVPLPQRLHSSLMLPLQAWGANIAVTVLETMGIPAVRYGSVMHVAGQQIAVAEACSGLRMILAFLIVTGVITYGINRPIWQKILVLLSSVPIALFCNVVRLIFSAYLISLGRVELAHDAFHDGAGLVMMPVAIGLVFLEFWVLSNLVVPHAGVSAIVEVVDDRVQRSGSLSGG